MKYLTLAALLVSAAQALSGHVMHHRAPLPALRHRHLAHRANPSPVFMRRRLMRRKTPLGPDDSTSQPSNLAQGSFGSSEGCTCWHTVQPGEVCLGLIDKSSAGFTIDTFNQFNPQVGSDCSNLVEGQAYCVDNGPNGDAPAPANAGSPTTTSASAEPTATAQQLAHASSGGDNDDDDCDDSDGTDDADGTDDSDDDCDDDSSDGDDALDAPLSSAPSSSNNYELTSSSSAANGKPTGKSGGGGGKQFSGQATWYTQNGNAGNCGQVNPDSAYIVALPTEMYANGAHCGASLKITNTANGNSATAKVADSCPSCGSMTDLDMSTALFGDLSGNNMGEGVFPMTWEFTSD